MANKKSNFPGGEVSRLSGTEFAKDTIICLKEIGNRGKPRNETELRARINAYFDFCAERSFRPGFESLSLALGVSRQTYWMWLQGRGGYSAEWQCICEQARQTILAFLEQASLTGKLNPATSIFLLKNTGGYKDVISFDESAQANETLIDRPLSLEHIRRYSLPEIEAQEEEDERKRKAGMIYDELQGGWIHDFSRYESTYEEDTDTAAGDD